MFFFEIVAFLSKACPNDTIINVSEWKTRGLILIIHHLTLFTLFFPMFRQYLMVTGLNV